MWVPLSSKHFCFSAALLTQLSGQIHSALIRNNCSDLQAARSFGVAIQEVLASNGVFQLVDPADMPSGAFHMLQCWEVTFQVHIACAIDWCSALHNPAAASPATTSSSSMLNHIAYSASSSIAEQKESELQHEAKQSHAANEAFEYPTAIALRSPQSITVVLRRAWLFKEVVGLHAKEPRYLLCISRWKGKKGEPPWLAGDCIDITSSCASSYAAFDSNADTVAVQQSLSQIFDKVKKTAEYDVRNQAHPPLQLHAPTMQTRLNLCLLTLQKNDGGLDGAQELILNSDFRSFLHSCVEPFISAPSARQPKVQLAQSLISVYPNVIRSFEKGLADLDLETRAVIRLNSLAGPITIDLDAFINMRMDLLAAISCIYQKHLRHKQYSLDALRKLFDIMCENSAAVQNRSASWKGEVLTRLSSAYLARNMREEAVAFIEQALVVLRPLVHNPQVRSLFCQALVTNANLDEEEKEDSAPRLDAGKKMLLEKSVSLCDEAIALSPGDRNALVNKAHALFELDRLDEACVHYAKVKEMNSPGSYYAGMASANIANVRFTQGRDHNLSPDSCKQFLEAALLHNREAILIFVSHLSKASPEHSKADLTFACRMQKGLLKYLQRPPNPEGVAYTDEDPAVRKEVRYIVKHAGHGQGNDSNSSLP
jgi:tetratricopeptide (TPR) repeat protein